MIPGRRRCLRNHPPPGFPVRARNFSEVNIVVFCCLLLDTRFSTGSGCYGCFLSFFVFCHPPGPSAPVPCLQRISASPTSRLRAVASAKEGPGRIFSLGFTSIYLNSVGFHRLRLVRHGLALWEDVGTSARAAKASAMAERVALDLFAGLSRTQLDHWFKPHSLKPLAWPRWGRLPAGLLSRSQVISPSKRQSLS